MKDSKILVIGGDERSLWLCRLFKSAGSTVYAVGFDEEILPTGVIPISGIQDILKYRDFEAVILPMPLSDGLKGEKIFSPLCSETLICEEVFFAIEKLNGYLGEKFPVFAGRTDPKSVDTAAVHGITINDYSADEGLILQNGVITAEGAISLAIDNSTLSLWDSSILICGYGRVAKALTKRMKGLCRNISVFARRDEALAEISCDGYLAVPPYQLLFAATQADIIINTVPSRIFDEGIIEKLNTQTLFIELASAPGGINPDFCKNIKFIKAPGLPSKTAPESAAAAILKVISKYL